MTDFHWTLLADINNKVESPEALSPGLTTAIIDRLEQAIAAPQRADIDDLSSDLTKFFESFLRKAPEDAASAVRGDPASRESAAAYALGLLEFAQQMAAQIAISHADDGFVDALKSNRLRPYIEALRCQELTGLELAQRVRERPETVSRKLKELRELGISDARRDGTNFFNYLTPAGRASFDGLAEPARDDPPGFSNNDGRTRFVEHLTKQLPPHLRTVPALCAAE